MSNLFDSPSLPNKGKPGRPHKQVDEPIEAQVTLDEISESYTVSNSKSRLVPIVDAVTTFWEMSEESFRAVKPRSSLVTFTTINSVTVNVRANPPKAPGSNSSLLKLQPKYNIVDKWNQTTCDVVYYTNTTPTPYIDAGRKVVRSEPVFEYVDIEAGRIIVDVARQPMLYYWLMFHPQLQGGLYQDNTKEALFFEGTPEAIAANNVGSSDGRVMSMALSLIYETNSSDAVRGAAEILKRSYPFLANDGEKPFSEIQNDLSIVAKENPLAVIEALNNKEEACKAIALQAQKRLMLLDNSTNNQWELKLQGYDTCYIPYGGSEKYRALFKHFEQYSDDYNTFRSQVLGN